MPHAPRVTRYSNGCCTLSLDTPISTNRLKKWYAKINGNVQDVILDDPDDRQEQNKFCVKYDFLTHLVCEFEIVTDDNVIYSVHEDSRFFRHSPESIHSNIQMRFLPVAGGLRYLSSIQAYLWVQKVKESISSDDYLRLSSYTLCCCIYRLMEKAAIPDQPDYSIVLDRVESHTSCISLGRLSLSEARWWPSLQYAKSQLLLCSSDVSRSIQSLEIMVNQVTELLIKSPITAYNLSLALPLLVSLLYSQSSIDDAALTRYRFVWEHIFRCYSSIMEIRFGTMHEYLTIYHAWMVSCRLNDMIAPPSYQDKRFVPVTEKEIVNLCIRVNLHIGTEVRLKKIIKFPANV